MTSILARSTARRVARQRKAARREFLSCAAVVVGMALALPVVIGFADILSTGMGNKSLITAMLEANQSPVCQVIAYDAAGNKFIAGEGSEEDSAMEGAVMPVNMVEFEIVCSRS